MKDFTEQELKDLRHGLLQTWDIIGHDILEITGEPIDRKEVIETVLDADHPLVQGYVSQELWKKFMNVSFKEQNTFAKTAFTHKLYGY